MPQPPVRAQRIEQRRIAIRLKRVVDVVGNAGRIERCAQPREVLTHAPRAIYVGGRACRRRATRDRVRRTPAGRPGSEGRRAPTKGRCPPCRAFYRVSRWISTAARCAIGVNVARSVYSPGACEFPPPPLPRPSRHGSMCAMKPMSPAPRSAGSRAATGPRARSRLAPSSTCEQRLVAGRRRHRRVGAVVEAQRRLRARQVPRHDRLHALARRTLLFEADVADVAARDGRRRNDVRLAFRGAAVVVERRLRAADDDARIDREVLLGAELGLEGREDAGRLVDRAATALRPEDPARMAGFARHLERPAVDAAAADRGRSVDRGLEAERGVASRASSSIGPREAASGMPASSSSPVNMTVMRRSSSAPAACSALSACSITTAPPFMSAVPVP